MVELLNQAVLFTDLEGSTALWEQDATAMRELMDEHDAIIRAQIDDNGGEVFKSTGDGVGALFEVATKAVSAAIDIQRQLQTAVWPWTRPRVRVGVHIGQVSPAFGDYYGAAVHRAARITEAANGDQILVSAATAAAIDDGTIDLVDLGDHRLRGIGVDQLHRVDVPGIDNRLDPPRVPSMRSAVPPLNRRTIGRVDEVHKVARLLGQERVVTIVGPGGVGKTHLGNEVARSVASRYSDGVVMIALDSVAGSDAVVSVVAQAIGARTQPGMSLEESLVDYLTPRNMLVVLDNCEHVSTAALDIVSTLRSLPGVDTLATSRAPLGLVAEQIVTLEPLPIATDAVELFHDCASTLDAGLAVHGKDGGAIIEICRYVGGLPLGIELAAAWLHVLSPSELRDRLSESVDIGLETDAGRHATMRSTVEWSVAQLTESEAALFARVSVFAGSFTSAAAEQVCSDGGDDFLAALGGLVRKSMLTVHSSSGQLRFSMLRPIRFIASEELAKRGEVTAQHDRLASHVLALVEKSSAELISENESENWQLLSEEWDNIRRCFETLLDTEQDVKAANLLMNLGWFATFSLRGELFDWAERLIDAISDPTAEALGSLYGLTAIQRYFVLADDGRSLAEAGLAVDPTDPHGFCRIALGSVWVKNQHTDEESESWTADGLANITHESPRAAELWAHVMRAFHLANHDPLGVDAEAHLYALASLAEATRSPTAETLACFSKGMSSICAELASSESGSIDAGIIDLRRAQHVASSVQELHLVGWLARGLELHFISERAPLVEVLSRCHEAIQAAVDHHYLAGTSHLLGVTAIALTRADRADIAAQLVRTMRATGHVPRPNATAAVQRVPSEDLISPLSIHEAAELALSELDSALARTLGP